MTEPAGGELITPNSPKAQVIAWLLDGHRDEDIRESLFCKFPGVNSDDVLAEVCKYFEDAATCDKTLLIGWAIEAYRDLYRRMVAIGDFANALRAVKELAALAGKNKGVRSRETEREASPESAAPRDVRQRRVGRNQPRKGR